MRTLIGSSLVLGLATAPLGAVDTDYELPPLAVTAATAANEVPATGLDTPVTLLRYETRVDIQARGLAENQADLTIRGGIFENSGLSLGALALYDPQTGHYLTELPLDPHMLRRPEVRTGVANSLGGFNATAGSVVYGLAPIETSGELALGATAPQGYSVSAYQGYALDERWAVDVGLGQAEGEGTLDRSDYATQRLAGRVQFRTAQAQTDAFVSYQTKEYGLPGMYVGDIYGRLYPEFESYEVLLAGLHHTQRYGQGGEIAIAAAFRSLIDDYEFNRDAPSRLYEHSSRLGSLGVQGHHHVNDRLGLRYGGAVLADDLESTNLTYGKFMSRTYWSANAAAEYAVTPQLLILGGFSYLETNRDPGHIAPLARVSYEIRQANATHTLYAEAAGASQVVGYTALNSNAAGGLFRGNRDLAPIETMNYELGYRLETADWQAQAAAFVRTADDFVDWVYVQGGAAARYARAFDVETSGLELTATRRWQAASATLGYAWLDKDPELDGLAGGFDASFYGLNYAEHRLTLSGVVDWPETFQWRADLEARQQAENRLRRDGDKALLLSLGVTWRPQWVEGLALDLVVDNALNTNYQDIPGTPSEGRTAALRGVYRW